MKITSLFKKIWPKMLAVYPTVIWVNLVAIVCWAVGIVALSALHLDPTQLATVNSMVKATMWIQGVLLGVHTWFVSCEDYPTNQSAPLKTVAVEETVAHPDCIETINTRRLKL